MGTFGEIRGEGRRFVALLLSLALLQVAGFYLAGAMVNGAGPLAIPQPDTSLYLQAAKRVAEGHPFSFSNGSAVCTGTTSVLHPFLLAVPYALGFRGPSLVTAGFWLNALFYFLFVGGWGLVIWHAFSGRSLRIFAAVMLVLFPQTAYGAFSQSDIGLLLAWSGLLAAGLVLRKPLLYGAMLAVGPWVRPEGAIAVVAFSAVTVLAALPKTGIGGGERGRPAAVDFAIAAVGVLSVLGVFGLNVLLTGHAQFSSVANKGYLNNCTFAVAVQKTSWDLFQILRALVFGQAASAPRVFYAIPLLGAAALWAGALVHGWRTMDWRRFVVPLAMLGGVLTVAQSGWQNTNVDRYLAWVMPLPVLLAAEGAYFLRERFRGVPASCLFVALPLLYSVWTVFYFMTLFHSLSRVSERMPSFARDLNKIMPQNVSVGLTGYCGFAYELEDRRIAHLSGIYSPEFSAKSLYGNLEILKNEPETRFDFWLFADDDPFPKELRECQGRQIAVGPEGVDVRRADWRAFSAAAAEPTNAVPGLVLQARVDVGYERDEKASDYQIVPRYHLKPYDAFVRVEALDGGVKAIDSGRVIYGHDEMSVTLQPGKDVKVVMRTLREIKLTTVDEIGQRGTFDFAYESPLELHIEVDGVEAGHSHADLRERGFTDAVFTIPGKAIVRPNCRIAFHGDHVTCGYWFYQ